MGKKKSLIPYERAVEVISAPKEWVSPVTFASGWVKPSTGKIPSQFSLRAIFLIDGDQLEGCKIDVSYKRSPNGLTKDAVSFSLLVDNSRALGVDDKGAGGHPNDVGRGLPHFGEFIPHPHLHLPVPEASYGYAVPLDPSMTHQELWTLFLQQANVVNAPPFEKPPAEQRSLLS